MFPVPENKIKPPFKIRSLTFCFRYALRTVAMIKQVILLFSCARLTKMLKALNAF